jgi:hypothetical protein
MHDLGKLVLAANFDEQYSGAQALARQQRLPLWEVEKQIFGGSHAEIGAYLLGLWGMPLDLVEAAALHHNPSRCLTKRFNALTAVHVANALVYEAKPDKEGMVAPEIDEGHLAELGLAGQLQLWREMVLAQDFGDTVFLGRFGDTGVFKKPVAAAAKLAPRPAKPAPAPFPARSDRASVSGMSRPRWVCAGMAVILLLIAFLLATQALMRVTVASAVQSDRGKAASQPMPVAAIAPPAAPAALLAAAPSATALAASASIRNPQSAIRNDAEPPAAAPETAPLVGPPASASAAPPPPSPKERAFAQLQLQSIFYSQSNPSAVISGTRVRPQDRLPAGATVVEIGPSSVTLEFDKERKILALR